MEWLGRTAPPTKKLICLQKFARVVLGTNNIDHHRTADFPAFAAALSGKPKLTASMRDVYNAPAMLLIGNDPDEPASSAGLPDSQQRATASRQVVHRQFAGDQTPSPGYELRRRFLPEVKDALAAFLGGDDAQSGSLVSSEMNREAWISWRDKLRAEPNLVMIFGSEVRGAAIASLAKFAAGMQGAKLICLGDYANSRGAADMGLYPDLLPGYHHVSDTGPFHEEWGSVPQSQGLDLPGMVESAQCRKAAGVLCGGRESDWTIRNRSLRFFEEFRRRAGHVPDRNGSDCRCSSARCECL